MTTPRTEKGLYNDAFVVAVNRYRDACWAWARPEDRKSADENQRALKEYDDARAVLLDFTS